MNVWLTVLRLKSLFMKRRTFLIALSSLPFLSFLRPIEAREPELKRVGFFLAEALTEISDKYDENNTREAGHAP